MIKIIYTRYCNQNEDKEIDLCRYENVSEVHRLLSWLGWRQRTIRTTAVKHQLGWRHRITSGTTAADGALG